MFSLHSLLNMCYYTSLSIEYFFFPLSVHVFGVTAKPVFLNVIGDLENMWIIEDLNIWRALQCNVSILDDMTFLEKNRILDVYNIYTLVLFQRIFSCRITTLWKLSPKRKIFFFYSLPIVQIRLRMWEDQWFVLDVFLSPAHRFKPPGWVWKSPTWTMMEKTSPGGKFILK